MRNKPLPNGKYRPSPSPVGFAPFWLGLLALLGLSQTCLGSACWPPQPCRCPPISSLAEAVLPLWFLGKWGPQQLQPLQSHPLSTWASIWPFLLCWAGWSGPKCSCLVTCGPPTLGSKSVVASSRHSLMTCLGCVGCTPFWGVNICDPPILPEINSTGVVDSLPNTWTCEHLFPMGMWVPADSTTWFLMKLFQVSVCGSGVPGLDVRVVAIPVCTMDEWSPILHNFNIKAPISPIRFSANPAHGKSFLDFHIGLDLVCDPCGAVNGDGSSSGQQGSFQASPPSLAHGALRPLFSMADLRWKRGVVLPFWPLHIGLQEEAQHCC